MISISHWGMFEQPDLLLTKRQSAAVSKITRFGSNKRQALSYLINRGVEFMQMCERADIIFHRHARIKAVGE